MNMKRFSLQAKSILILLILLVQPLLFAEKTPVENLYRYKLENGLELFVMENDSAPLVYIEIAVRTGAVSQTPENAGLFHLYEHMMFKGNDKYKNQKEVTAALNKLGVSDWNGTTGIDRVNYFFTIPSNMAKEGMDFWSHAIRNPLIDEKELENEKSVVLSEITADESDPGAIMRGGLWKNLLSESPWRIDPSGKPDTVKNATRDDLIAIQKTYYVPKNAALFVGGDVKHEEIYKYAKEIYGGWENSKETAEILKIKCPTKNPVLSDTKLVFADPRSSGDFTRVSFYLRGPDGESDADDTYGADVWGYLLADPSSDFSKAFVSDKDLQIPDADYVGAGYTTFRASGVISVSAAMLSGGSLSEEDKAIIFLETARKVTEEELKGKKDFSKEKIESASRRIEDSRVYELETAEGFLSTLSSIWSSCGADYFFDYEKKIASIKTEDVTDFIEKYVKAKPGVLILTVSPDYFKSHKAELEKKGWKEITAENAFWWKDN